MGPEPGAELDLGLESGADLGLEAGLEPGIDPGPGLESGADLGLELGLEPEEVDTAQRRPHDTSGLDLTLDTLLSLMAVEVAAAKQHSARQRAVLLFESGHLEELLFGKTPSALAQYEEALAQDATFLPVMRSLGRHLAVRKRWSDLLAIRQTELKYCRDEATRAALMTEMGQILSSQLSDTEGAIKHLRTAFGLNPRAREPAELLRGIFLRQARWDELMEFLRGLANITGSERERAQLLVEMAELSELRLGRVHEAEELYTQALALQPDGEHALVALRRLYQLHGRFRELSALLTQEAEQRIERDPARRFADLYRAARLAEIHLHNDMLAASLLERACTLDPAELLPLQALAVIYQRNGHHQDLAAALSRQLQLVPDRGERASLCYRLGRVYEDWLDQPQQAVAAYREALDERPGHEATMRTLASLLERQGQWDELVDLLLLRAEWAQSPVRRANDYLSTARLCEERLQDPRRAMDLYERAYRLPPAEGESGEVSRSGHAEAFRCLERLYRREGRWDSLAELYEREAGRTSDRALAVSLLRAAARIQEEVLGNQRRAIETLVRLQERLAEPVAGRPDRPAQDGDQAGDRETILALARLYEETGRPDQLFSVLEQWAADTEDEEVRNELRRRMGELLEGPLRRPDLAVELYREILGDAPGDLPTLDRLKAFYERSGRWEDLVETLHWELMVTPRGEQAAVQHQIGQVSLHKLGDVERARAAFEEALALDPTFTPTLQALEDLLRGNGLFEPLVHLLQSRAEQSGDPVRAVAQLCLAAEICEEQLQDAPRAQELFERVLEIEPACGLARTGLERILQAAGTPDALLALYTDDVKILRGRASRLRALLRLGRFMDGPGNDPFRAAEAYQLALAEAGEGSLDPLFALARVLRRAGDWEGLCQVLPRIAGSDDVEISLAALREWAWIIEWHLSDQLDPAPVLQRVLDADPYDPHTLTALERLAYEREDGRALVALSQRQLHLCTDEDLEVSYCFRGAVLLVVEGELEQATELLRGGLKTSPAYLPAVWLLRLLDERLGHWEEAAELLLREGDLAVTPKISQAALIRAGDLLWKKFNDTHRAQKVFGQVFEENPEHEAAFRRLVVLLGSTSEHEKLASVYRRRMEVLGPGERIPLQMELAVLYRDRLLDPLAAADVLQELLAVAPDDLPALNAMADLTVALKRWGDADRILEQLAEAARGEAETRRKALLIRAQVLEEQLGDADQALQVARVILAEFPYDRDGLLRCVAIYQRRRDWESMVGTLDELARSGPPAERVHHLVTMAEIYLHRLGDEARGTAVLRRAAALAVESGAGVERLVEHFERNRDHQGFAELLGRALEGIPPEGTPGSVSMRLALARFVATRMRNPAEAERQIRRALDSSPRSVEARLQLAGLQLWSKRLGEATSEYLRILEQDPFCVEAYRGLHKVFEQRGDRDRMAGAAQVICAVSGKEVPECATAARGLAAVEAALTRPVTSELGVADLWHLLAHPDEPAGARELLHLTGDYISQVFPDEVQRFEARLTGESGLVELPDNDPVAQLCSRLAATLGLQACRYLGGRLKLPTMLALPGSTPSIVIDGRLQAAVGPPPAVLRFQAGRALTEALTRSVHLHVLKPQVMELFLLAVVEMFEKGWASQMGCGREVEELARMVGKAVPRKLRRGLEGPARNFAAGKPTEVQPWVVASRRTAERVGLLLCGDVKAALSVLVAEKAPRAVQAELLRFAVGPHLYEARRRLGLVG